MDYQTIEEARAYMDGVLAERESITKMIRLEIDKRQAPPLPIKHWTNFILAMINRNDKTEQEVLDQSTQEYLADIHDTGNMPALIKEILTQAIEELNDGEACHDCGRDDVRECSNTQGFCIDCCSHDHEE